MRLPKALAAQLRVRENDPLELTVRAGVLQLRPIKRERQAEPGGRLPASVLQEILGKAMTLLR